MTTGASVLARTPFLVGAAAHNLHVQSMTRALHEAGALAAYVTGGVDCYSSAPARGVRAFVAMRVPALDRQLARRAITEVPHRLVEPHWGWEAGRVLASRAGALRLEDWCWERQDLALDRLCANRVARASVGAFLGVEHGALASLRAARTLGKPAVVAFLSPHHATHAAWMDAEYAAHPELRSPARAAVDARAISRDARRDDEAQVAHWIVTNSSFTTQSLVDAGLAPERLLTVPLGGPDPIDACDLPRSRPATLRVVYVGPVSVRKGAHYLLRAWRRVAGPGVELHFYGARLLPEAVLADAVRSMRAGSVHFHGSVPSHDLPAVYRHASVLVLPTLCDGFGQVVTEALAHGLPVVTTRNAGAADALTPGRTGLVIEPASEDALVAALQWCVDHPEDLFEMRAAALTSARRWTWAHYRERFREALGGALSGAPVGPACETERVGAN
jgi:glycosyltransferase involved in cell wall biosynthesis